MTLYKCGKNRQLDIEPFRIHSLLKTCKSYSKKFSKGIYTYLLKETFGIEKILHRKIYVRTREDYYKAVGRILGIIPLKIVDVNGDKIEEFFWFNDVREYTEEELYDDSIDFPVCFYSNGINKRLHPFI